MYNTIFCVDVKWQIYHQPSLFPKRFNGIERLHQLHLKTPFCDSLDIQVKVSLAVSRHYPAQPFHPVLVLAFVLGNFLVACICAWRHFLGIWLYSNYTIGHQNLERVLCLILPSRLVEYVSFTSILRCQSILQECISRRGLLHYSEGTVLSWGSTVALNCFLPQKSVSRMTRGRSRKKKCGSSKSTDENDHSPTGQGEEIVTPPAQRTSPRRRRPE